MPKPELAVQIWDRTDDPQTYFTFKPKEVGMNPPLISLGFNFINGSCSIRLSFTQLDFWDVNFTQLTTAFYKLDERHATNFPLVLGCFAQPIPKFDAEYAKKVMIDFLNSLFSVYKLPKAEIAPFNAYCVANGLAYVYSPAVIVSTHSFLTQPTGLSAQPTAFKRNP